MSQNVPSTTVAEEIDSASEPTVRKRRVEKDSELQGRPLSEVIFMLRASASHFINEIDTIPELMAPDLTNFVDHDLETNTTYVIKKLKNERLLAEISKKIEDLEKTKEIGHLTKIISIDTPASSFANELSEQEKKTLRRNIQDQIDVLQKEYKLNDIGKLNPIEKDEYRYILIVKKALSTSDYNVERYTDVGNITYSGRKYYLPFSPHWNKNEFDDIRLMESIAGASLIGMNDIMRNYKDYYDFIDNTNQWRTLFLKMYEAEKLGKNTTITTNPSLRLPTFYAVRQQALSILRIVNNVENKMSTLFNMILDTNDNSPEERAREVAAIIAHYNRDESTEDGRGRNDAPAYGRLDCEQIVNGVAVPRNHSSQREFDKELSDAFNGKPPTSRAATRPAPSYMERVRLLNNYLSQNLRFAFKTSNLPLYIEKPVVEFNDRWKGAIRDSIERYSTDANYKNVIESYRDILLPAKNDPIIALFAEFITKRADNTQMTMRPYQNNYALTHHQLDRNKVQYKAKEKEMDNMIKRIFPDIRKKKRARF